MLVSRRGDIPKIHKYLLAVCSCRLSSADYLVYSGKRRLFLFCLKEQTKQKHPFVHKRLHPPVKLLFGGCCYPSVLCVDHSFTHTTVCLSVCLLGQRLGHLCPVSASVRQQEAREEKGSGESGGCDRRGDLCSCCCVDDRTAGLAFPL